MRRIRVTALLIAFVALLGACADEEPTVQGPEEAEATPTPAMSPAAEATVAVAESDHGEILVDAEGMTLYVFLRDTAGQSNCTDACAQTWPPLTVDADPVAGDDVNEGLLDTIERADGDMQVTYNDRPLYNYAQDDEAGDTNGQGVGGNWYVVGPDGEPIRD